jgi:hypothetical protein
MKSGSGENVQSKKIVRHKHFKASPSMVIFSKNSNILPQLNLGLTADGQLSM